MTRCLDCGAPRAADQCPACGLTSAAAEVLLRRRLFRRTAWFLLGAIIFIPVSRLYPPLDMDPILIFVGVMFFLVLSLGFWIDLRARHRQEIELMKRIYFGFLPVPWLLTALLFLNGRFDAAPPARPATTVVGKFSMPGFLRTNRLVVRSWRNSGEVERVPVDPDDFLRFQRGDQVIVQVHEGLVSIPWVFAVYRKE